MFIGSISAIANNTAKPYFTSCGKSFNAFSNVIVNKAENNRQTVIEYAPDSEQAQVYRNLADDILKNTELSIPTPLKFEELEDLVASYGNQD